MFHVVCCLRDPPGSLDTDLESAQHWFNCNKWNLNVSIYKCKWMMFGTVQRLRRTKATELYIGENPLERYITINT